MFITMSHSYADAQKLSGSRPHPCNALLLFSNAWFPVPNFYWAVRTARSASNNFSFLKLSIKNWKLYQWSQNYLLSTQWEKGRVRTRQICKACKVAWEPCRNIWNTAISSAWFHAYFPFQNMDSTREETVAFRLFISNNKHSAWWILSEWLVDNLPRKQYLSKCTFWRYQNM